MEGRVLERDPGHSTSDTSSSLTKLKKEKSKFDIVRQKKWWRTTIRSRYKVQNLSSFEPWYSERNEIRMYKIGQAVVEIQAFKVGANFHWWKKKNLVIFPPWSKGRDHRSVLEGHKRPKFTAEAGVSERQGTGLGLGRISTCGEQEPQVGVKLVKIKSRLKWLAASRRQERPGNSKRRVQWAWLIVFSLVCYERIVRQQY